MHQVGNEPVKVEYNGMLDTIRQACAGVDSLIKFWHPRPAFVLLVHNGVALVPQFLVDNCLYFDIDPFLFWFETQFCPSPSLVV